MACLGYTRELFAIFNAQPCNWLRQLSRAINRSLKRAILISNKGLDTKMNQPVIDFSTMLPLGMIAQGGLAAQVLAELAQAKRGEVNWEAFYYERQDEQHFLVTGGQLHIENALRRHLEPHEQVVVSQAELEHALQARLMPAAVAAPRSAAPSALSVTPQAALATRMQHEETTDYLHLSLALPNDPAQRLQLFQQFHIQAQVNGAHVVSCTLSNTIVNK